MMRNNKDPDRPNVEIDLLKHIFMKAKERLLTESDALQNNLTRSFWTTCRDKIDHRELIIIAVRGEVRTGKSTVVLKIMQELNAYIKSIGLNPEPMRNLTKYIFSDQTEFLRFINGDERNACLAIDEFNSMAATGLNATTEEALFDHYSDVFAGQYLHRVTASPDIITDKNATMILDVIGKDEEKRIVRCKLTYRDIITKQQMVIGKVDIYVGDVIKGWIDDGIRDLVEERGLQNCTPQELKVVEDYRMNDFYVRYQIKKYKRMDLTKKHGVRDIRDLEFSVLILQAIRELQDFAKINKVDKELVDTVVDEVVKQHKRIYSILTVNEISNRAKAILNLYHKIQDLYKRRDKMKKNLKVEELLIFNKTIAQAEQLLERRVGQQEKYSGLYEEYMRIE